LSDSPSIRDYRITKPCFHTCSTHESHSLATFYLYARCLIANQAEVAYWAPPLLFGRRPPQSNCPTDTVRRLDSQESTLELMQQKGGISPMAPPELAPRDQHEPNISLQSRFTGSFRLAAGTWHLHHDYNFTGLVLETVFLSLRLSCTSELTRQGTSLP
jgi:hypothetical protein